MKKISLFWCLPILLAVLNAQAQSFCFLSASTYYEQVYCELQAKGEARGLPPFHQFKRNDETIQAVILKRPAARIGIHLPAPVKRATPADAPVSANNHSEAAAREPATRASPVNNTSPARLVPPAGASSHLSGCELAGAAIHCADRRYQLTGNRLNHRLSPLALTADNLMALPVYQGQPLNRYLADAYRQYMEKMHEIGLAGATLTYSKFSFLFDDVREKGLDFSQRFETMYGFLKKDKATMGVSEKVSADQELTLADCDSLSEQLLVCSRAGRNYLYVAVSE